MSDAIPHFFDDPTDWEFFEAMDKLIVENKGLERFEAKRLVMRLHNCFHYISQQEDRVNYWIKKCKENEKPKTVTSEDVYPKGSKYAGD